MSTFEKQMDKVRAYFDEHKAERYPFENPYLKDKEEYIKSLYYRMLCALIRYPDEPDDMQVLYVRRLIAGTKAEGTFQDYMKMALDLNTDDINEFISVFHEDILRFYFCVDGLVLLSERKSNEKTYALLSEVVELLGIAKDELQYLTAIAVSIVTQDSQAFEDAKSLATRFTKDMSFYPYIKGFYSGMILDTDEEKHIYSCDGSEITLGQYAPYNAKRVIIENISCVLDKNIVFDGCAEVVIRNCILKGNNYRFEFHQVGKVMIEDCEISDFTNRFAWLKNTNNLFVHSNRFKNCGCSSSSNIIGGIFYVNKGYLYKVVFEKNEFLNCFVEKEGYEGKATGIVLGTEESIHTIMVIKNQFCGCECRNTWSSIILTKFYIVYHTADEKTVEDNVCTGSNIAMFS